MSAARTARRRRRQMAQNNNHLSGIGVSRYRQPPDKDARSRQWARKVARWQKLGSNMAGGAR